MKHACGLLLGLTLIALALGQDPPKASAPAEPGKSLRLFEQEPYDLLRFKDGKEQKVQPLILKGRRFPDKPRATDKLVVKTAEEADAEYEVAWGDIDLEKSRLFEQLILEEAEQLVATGKFNEAYDFYDHLQRFYAKLPGLDESLQNYLFEEAKHYQKLGQFDQSLALLNEIHVRNPRRPDLANALGVATGKLVEQKLAKNDFSSARRLLKSLLDKSPQNPAAQTWVDRLSQQARESLTQGQAHFAAGRFREAADAARNSLRIWPLEEGRRLLTDAHQKFPRVVVGVSLPAGNRDASPLIDWAARRSARLFNRRLLEFSGFGPQGGKYQCPVGNVDRLDLGMRMVFQIHPNIPWSDNRGVLTGHDVARRLLQMAEFGHPAYRPDWADLFRAVSVREVYEVDVELRRAHVHPDGMLSTILTPWDSAAEAKGRTGSIGPYVVGSASVDEVRYLANDLYFATSSTQPRELVERYFPDQRKAVPALKSGEIAMLDRIVPWEIEALKASPDLVVQRYAVPTIHCLIPNLEQPLISRRAFRRALVYGINRTEILQGQLLRGAPATLGQVVSGPFPRGENLDDPVGYAYNEDVAPLPYNPALGLTLVGLSRQELLLRDSPQANAAPMPGAEPTLPAPLPPVPKLVLAHPPHDIARVACRAIKKQLEVIGVPIELKELPAQPAAGAEVKWDLLYAELAIWEPVIDARYLLGPQGLVGHCSPYMDLTLRQLEQAEDWKRVRDKLLDVHKQAHEDLAVLPLWQLVDHFACQKNLEGVGTRPVMLYQNIESWRAPPWFAAEAL